ncbi:hypothetical protein A2856_00670 [Candidatus Uhrbacteria bacterium RIFCSPHIGHO2_01_FULL_63_20]|uniref:LTD domain-containing protein n=1 Tax=Candidatus Uhrbacteria bacterium RIFCSPHIGHO2_01_FULL_63_20 TaxID=1802385 RepID=A0A1F7TLY4_9BACT|nr:MAG: hypothetical protein A2856_00670 [Candidatus Uhrbacteria bacterium RIFCSPHIGHO2_01_FULL_63_20]
MKYLILVGLLAAAPIHMAYAQEAPRVILSEIAWAGSSLNASDEWIELANTGDEPVDLSGYVLDGAATSGGTLALPAGAVIAARGTYVIANFATSDERSALLAADHVTSAVSLSNTALKIVLRDAAGAELDRAGDGKAPSAGSSAPFTSMTRLEDGTFASSAESVGFKEGVTDLGTPGSHPFAAETVEEAPATVEEPAPIPEPVTEELPTAEPEEVVVPNDGAGPSDTDPPVEDPSAAAPQDDTSEEAPVIDEQASAAPDPVEGQDDAVATDDIPSTSSGNIASDTLPPSISFPPGTLRVSELYPAPESGEDEWVEIDNPFNNVIPLDGWTISDASGTKTALPDQLLGFGRSVVIRNPKGKLNNDGDTLTLLAPDGSAIDAVAYGKDGQKAGRSFIRVEDHLELTLHPTPGETNVLETAVAAISPERSEPVAAMTATPVATTTPSTSSVTLQPISYVPPAVVAPAITQPKPAVVQARPVAVAKPVATKPAPKPAAKPKVAAAKRTASARRVNAEDLADLKLKTKVVAEGTVTVLPGTSMGKQRMAIKDETGEIPLYKNDSAFGELSLGDRIRVAGTISSAQGEKRINVTTVTVLKRAPEIVPIPARTEEVVPPPTKDASRRGAGAMLASSLVAGLALFALRPHAQRLIARYVSRHALPVAAQTPD